jgi:Fe-S cluster assembly iron-binding protein IscA
LPSQSYSSPTPNRITLQTKSPSTSVTTGIRIDFTPEYKNALFPIRLNDESSSKETSQSDLHHEKHSSPRISTFFGIRIDFTDECENAYFSIRVNDESSSKETSQSDSQPAKHPQPRNSTLFGIRIDLTED